METMDETIGMVNFSKLSTLALRVLRWFNSHVSFGQDCFSFERFFCMQNRNYVI